MYGYICVCIYVCAHLQHGKKVLNKNNKELIVWMTSITRLNFTPFNPYFASFFVSFSLNLLFFISFVFALFSFPLLSSLFFLFSANMYNPPHAMLLSPMGKRRELEGGDDISLETSQLMIRSPNVGTSKRPRYEPSWTIDDLCTHPCSPLAAIDLEVVYSHIRAHYIHILTTW